MGKPDLRLGVARSMNEMTFYCAHFVACPSCGAHVHEKTGTNWYRISRNDDGNYHSAGLYELLCKSCGRAHSVEFLRDQDCDERLSDYKRSLTGPSHGPYSNDVVRRLGHLGPPAEPSQVIEPHQFARFITDANDSLPRARDQLSFSDWDPYRWNLHDVIESLNELAKFIPENADVVDEAFVRTDAARLARKVHPEWFTRAWLDEQTARWTVLHDEVMAEGARRHALPADDPQSRHHLAHERPPLIHPFHRAMLRQHEKWLADKEGKEGQQLVARKTNASGYKLGFRDLSSAILDDVTLDRANMEMVRFPGSKLTRVSMRDANLDHAMLAGTELVGCTFGSSWLAFANLGDAVITDCDFTGARLDRSTWYRSRITNGTFADAKLNNAAFNQANFVGCNFRGADFSLSQARVLGTGWDAVFERCDLRETKWDGFDLYRAKFIDCQFAGATGIPILTEVIVTGGDVGDVRSLATQLGVDLDAAREPIKEVPVSDEPKRRQLVGRARAVLDGMIDKGASFDETVDALVALGLTREEALEAVIDPGRLATS